MSSALSMLKLSQVRPPVRRVLALDAGSRCLKLLLAESDFGRLHIRREELVDLQAEGLVSAEEIKGHLQTLLQEWGHPPLALAMAQHLSISQVVDLPLAPDSEVKKLIEDETLKLSGLSETRVVFDFVRTETPTKNRQQFWVTLSQEGHIREWIQRLGVEREDLCEVTTTANALMASFRATCPEAARAILVHLGAQSTVIVVLVEGHGAFASTFPMGSDFFTRGLMRLRHCPEDAAETLKRQTDLLNGAEALPEFAGVVDGWAAELKRQLNEWFDSHPGLVGEVASFRMLAGGGGFEQPGLLPYLNRTAGLQLKSWPAAGSPDTDAPSKRFHIAYGAALQALGYNPQPVSLLPSDYRLAWQKRLVLQRFEFASLLLAGLCALLLVAGTWHKLSLISRKETLRAKVTAAQDAAQENEQLTGELVAEYEGLRPLFAAQQNTVDVLKTLALLQQSRSNRSFWYVLLADQQTYFTRPLVSTNKTQSTNQVIAPLGPPRPVVVEPTALPSYSTNTIPPKSGLIAELCVPEDSEVTRRLLSQLVADLKKQRLFAKVDLLSDDLRRNLAEPKVVLPERDFVMALDFAETDFQMPLRLKRFGAALPNHAGPRRNPRSSGPSPEDAEGLSQPPP